MIRPAYAGGLVEYDRECATHTYRVAPEKLEGVAAAMLELAGQAGGPSRPPLRGSIAPSAARFPPSMEGRSAREEYRFV